MTDYVEFDMPILPATEIDDLDRNMILSQIEQNHFACIRGLFNPKKIQSVIKNIESRLPSLRFGASSGEQPEAVRTNFNKVNIGGASLRYNNYPRFFRTFYNPVWEEDIFEMRREFLQLIKLRNFVYGLEEQFALNRIMENGLFSACRLQHYPSGGGFFSTHRDTTLLDVAKEKSVNFYQLILVISQSNSHFIDGGAYLDKGKNRFMLESKCVSGDVLIYNGQSLHGVEEVDPSEMLDLNCLKGRVVALASLYKT